MLKIRKRTLFGLSGVFLLSFMLFSCKPGNRLHVPQNQTQKYLIVEDELTPTSTDEVTQKNGVTYQPFQNKIKNAQADILVGRVKIKKSKITYDLASRKMSVSGVAHVYSDQKNELSSTDFLLESSHQPDEGQFDLKAEKNIKANSSEKPIVRAQVTCLSLNNKDEFDCSRAVVDFFIAYKKQVFTEQMELIQKKPKTPTDDVLVVSEDISKADHKNDEIQPEGTEDSIDGRYQGSAETADLGEVFKDDEAPDKVIVNVRAKPADQAAPDKKEKPLTKDLHQTKDGDIRPINQAIGFPDNGRLRNATSLLEKQKALDDKAFFEISNPASNRYYSTYETAELLIRMSQTLNQLSSRKLYISAISQKIGGKVSPHLSHQIGLDADIAYPATQNHVKFPVVVQMNSRLYSPSSYSVAQTYELFKYAFKQQDIKVDRIFADRTIKIALCNYAKTKGEFLSADKDLVTNLFQNIDHVDGHGDHFHIRLKCSSYDPACRQKLYAVNNGCH
jgi:murein endopeptidase